MRKLPSPWFQGFDTNFAALCNILLIQSFHLKIVSAFSHCQEIVMIGPVLQPCIYIISRSRCACGMPAESGPPVKQMCLKSGLRTVSVLLKIICSQTGAKFGTPFTHPSLSQQMCTAKPRMGTLATSLTAEANSSSPKGKNKKMMQIYYVQHPGLAIIAKAEKRSCTKCSLFRPKPPRHCSM